MEEKTILLSCPVRDRAWVLPYYLKHIYNLDYPKKLISILWVLNQSIDDSEKILREFKKKYEHEYKDITIEKFNGSKTVPKDKRTTDIRNNHIYSHLSEMRNFILSKVGENDFLFSCDNDILVRPDMLRRLVNHDKDVISSLIYNGYLISRTEPYKYPNILSYNENNVLTHISNWYVKNSNNLTESKIVSIDVTGAVYLMTKDVAKNVRYGFDVQGEDIYFCNEAKGKRYEICCDVGIFSSHIMNEEMLREYVSNKEVHNAIN